MNQQILNILYSKLETKWVSVPIKPFISILDLSIQLTRNAGIYQIKTDTPINILKKFGERNDKAHYNFSKKIDESLKHNWIKSPIVNPLNQNEYFDTLRKHEVHFYDETKRVTPYKLISPIPKIKEVYKMENKPRKEEEKNEKILPSGSGGNSDY